MTTTDVGSVGVIDARLLPPALAPWAEVLGATALHAAAALVADSAELVQLAMAFAVWAPLNGHSHVNLDALADDVRRSLGERGAGVELPPLPATDDWLTALAESDLVRAVDGSRGPEEPTVILDDRPLVLWGHRVTTQRQWFDECTVARSVRTLTADVVGPPLSPIPLVEGDQLAAASGDRRLHVIVGGPGTGKTFTVGALLAARLADAGESASLRIGLAAPTGKAAARLTESIVGFAAQLPPGPIADRLGGLHAITLHRLLGPRPDHRSRFAHDAAAPLPYDLVVVDETSMVALPLMARLMEAIGPDTTLVLVGDPGQLESIEVGTVLGDLVAAGRSGAVSVSELTRQRRTGSDSPIAALADAVRRGDADAVIELLAASPTGLRFVDALPDREPDAAATPVWDAVGATYRAAVDAAVAADAAEALHALASSRVLCAHREGPFGVAWWNRYLGGRLSGGVADPLGVGRALLATRNDPRTGIVNGDTGIVVSAGVIARAAFARGATVRDFSLAELDHLETAWAMTVHKTQGSEYDTVAFVAPPDDSPLATRELLYTAITRARRELVIVGTAAAIRRCVDTPARRRTSLTALLTPPP